MRYHVLLLAASAAFGQTVSVSSPTAQLGKSVDVDISFVGAGAVAPTALEWVVSYPARDLTLVGTAPAPNPTLEAAGKSLACKGSWKKAPVTYSYKCILAGGAQPVPDGVIATFHFQIKLVKAGVLPVDIDDVSGVTADAKKIQVRKAGGKLSVAADAR